MANGNSPRRSRATHPNEVLEKSLHSRLADSSAAHGHVPPELVEEDCPERSWFVCNAGPQTLERRDHTVSERRRHQSFLQSCAPIRHDSQRRSCCCDVVGDDQERLTVRGYVVLENSVGSGVLIICESNSAAGVDGSRESLTPGAALTDAAYILPSAAS
jgi:hypothetical protein